MIPEGFYLSLQFNPELYLDVYRSQASLVISELSPIRTDLSIDFADVRAVGIRMYNDIASIRLDYISFWMSQIIFHFSALQSCVSTFSKIRVSLGLTVEMSYY